ncbi:putative cobalt-precorrin-4 C-methyltransferase protein [Marine Group I thaumarchaeote SCGC AAA799-P11]|uniref:Putative cobalt-precorrin-4 C-methyltransferase protein n=1 Tax=Marine Group I thaumarchaeote SCGC AAA799-P11 TaxID=1502295 RepID=A0A087RX71_9ARCH|nr:putative cobalt-precorrin-4 C-methyltransferase protein [Marine Group I thaumarchaeote SCGC AAA799-P11]
MYLVCVSSIYGAIKEQIDNLAKKGIKSTVVPGVTAFLASAAALGTQLTLPGVTQTIIVTRAESRTTKKLSEMMKLDRCSKDFVFRISAIMYAVSYIKLIGNDVKHKQNLK